MAAIRSHSPTPEGECTKRAYLVRQCRESKFAGDFRLLFVFQGAAKARDAETDRSFRELQRLIDFVEMPIGTAFHRHRHEIFPKLDGCNVRLGDQLQPSLWTKIVAIVRPRHRDPNVDGG